VDTKKIKKWIKTVALWQLICVVINLFLVILSQLSTIQLKFALPGYIEASFNVIGGLVIFLGLWRLAPWAWKVAVLFIPLSWAYVACDLFIDYQHGVGLIIFPFILIDLLILRFLFEKEVTDIFKISSIDWIKLSWLVGPLFLLAVSLLIYDLLNDIIAIILALAILTGYYRVDKYRRKLQSS